MSARAQFTELSELAELTTLSKKLLDIVGCTSLHDEIKFGI
jgi:hypothetical protein